jgi:2-polyprenyl-3-methyl-5-hydroxy-6-metoxy-1,4-benzoquinol methylase
MGFVNREAENLSGEKVGFSFGENWEKYLEEVDERRIEIACRSIRNFTGLDSLAGHTLLDAGCGSGLFSLAALRLGADRVTSIDIDPSSIECTSQLHLREGRPENWAISRQSVMATGFPPQSFSFVYSWGVLHHTGTRSITSRRWSRRAGCCSSRSTVSPPHQGSG